MPVPVHTVENVDGSTPVRSDRALVGVRAGIANGSAAAGVSVVVAVSGFKDLPASYGVQVTPSQDAVAFVSGKTSTGFNVTLFPRLAANALVAGTFDVFVIA